MEETELLKLVEDNVVTLRPVIATEPVKVTCETLHQRFLRPVRYAIEQRYSARTVELMIVALFEFTLECGAARHPFWPAMAETALRAREIVRNPETYPVSDPLQFQRVHS